MEGCDGTYDGGVDELTRRRYLRFAESGAGIIWFEATAVCPEGRANPRQLYINENTKASFKSLVEEVKALVKELAPFEEVIETIAGCTITSHCGPDCLGILFFTK